MALMALEELVLSATTREGVFGADGWVEWLYLFDEKGCYQAMVSGVLARQIVERGWLRQEDSSEVVRRFDLTEEGEQARI
jgi:hypothetical protein